MGNNKKRPVVEDQSKKFRKKTSILTYEGISYVDYKDVNLLRKFMSERAKIRQRKVTGNSQKQQREIAKAIRIAREMALLPFNVRQVTNKTKKRRDEETTLEMAEAENARPPRAKKEVARVEAVADNAIDNEVEALLDEQSVVANEEA